MAASKMNGLQHSARLIGAQHVDDDAARKRFERLCRFVAAQFGKKPFVFCSTAIVWLTRSGFSFGRNDVLACQNGGPPRARTGTDGDTRAADSAKERNPSLAFSDTEFRRRVRSHPQLADRPGRVQYVDGLCIGEPRVAGALIPWPGLLYRGGEFLRQGAGDWRLQALAAGRARLAEV